MAHTPIRQALSETLGAGVVVMAPSDVVRLNDPVAAEALLRSDIDDGIASGAWAPGSRLPTERALSKNYAIPRGRVRRVLSALEREGRITRTTGRGTFVCDPDVPRAATDLAVDEVSPEDLIETRLLLEPQIAALAVRRASLADLAALKALVSRGRRSRSMAEFEDIDHSFHLALAAASKNAYLASLIGQMHAVRRSPGWSRMRRRGLTADRLRTYQAQHEAIVEALEARNAVALRAEIKRHLEDVRRNLWLSADEIGGTD